MLYLKSILKTYSNRGDMMKKLNDKERFEILSLKEDDITKRKLAELFAATRQGDARFQTTDRFLLPVDADRKSVV